MIKLNTAILDYIEAKNRTIELDKNGHNIIKRHINRTEKKIKKIELMLLIKYPQFKHEIVKHITKSIKELMKERIDFRDYINNERFHKLDITKDWNEQDRDLLKKIKFMSFCHGRNRANVALNKITVIGNNKNHQLMNEFRKINQYKDYLINKYPSSTLEIEKYVKDNVSISQEIQECKIEKVHRPIEARLDDKAFVNLTNISIPEDIAMGLSFGPKFCFPTINNLDSNIRFIDYYIEHLELSFPIETHLEAYKQLSIEMNRENRSIKNTRDTWLNFLNYRIKRFKRLNPELCITNSDKGKHTVIMLNSEYTDKMNKLVLSTNDYLLLDGININELEEKNNKFAKVLNEIGSIDKECCSDSCTSISRMYGLVKIHKSNFPVRPITSACASPGFKMAKFCTKVLSDIFFEDGYHIINSSQFVDKLKDVDIQEDESMVSFDVVSMFTNIPVDHMIILISERSEEILSKYKIDFVLFKEILLFLLKECAVFTWNKKIYRQKDSLAMGSPMSPILAKILMTRIIHYTLSRIPVSPKLLSLYVDDSFWIMKTDLVHLVLETLNSYHEKN